MIWFWQRGSVLLVNVSEVSGLTVNAHHQGIWNGFALEFVRECQLRL